MQADVTSASARRSLLGRHWAARPLPEPPRTRRVSKWTRVPLDRLQDELEAWLRDSSVRYTYDGE